MKLAFERNERKRAQFIIRMGRYKPNQYVFVDESSLDSRTPLRRYGWSRKGQRARMKGCFVRGKRYVAFLPHNSFKEE
jgi:hypothetical protein